MLPLSWHYEAIDRLSDRIFQTPITYDGRNDLFIKWESYQLTGSFKLRGALNRTLSLAPWELDRGLVTASAGNHGLGLAYCGHETKTPVTVFVPENASAFKLDQIHAYGAQIKCVTGGYSNAERAGKLSASSSGATWVSAYNDGLVIAGQSTIAPEILSQFPESSKYTWIVPLGGGGLISGIASYLRWINPNARIIGVQVEASPFFFSILKRGTQEGVNDLPTLAEGLAGPIELNSSTIPIVKSLVKDIVLVSEQELIFALTYAWENYGEPIEPSGAAALAAILSQKVSVRPSIVIITGGNISPEKHAQLLVDAGKEAIY